LFDFLSGLGDILEEKQFPEISDELSFKESENLFLSQAQPISFHLTNENRCSILTGANSGGKTTLLEHIIQLITMFQLGLPIKDVKMPIFTDIYYFAKNKGVNGKGAFENLLTQMDKIKPGKKTLILADEIESVTEPGVAGKIISATAEFFINKDCFLIIATHLGGEIQKALPEYARIDGIEAKGLDEYYELIVDHNPVIGKLANSTPELIIEKMANTEKTDYLQFLYNKLKKKI
jgi:DNA mismatch repair protein MutS2